MTRRSLLRAGVVAAAWVASSALLAQTVNSTTTSAAAGVTLQGLLDEGYSIAAASSDGTSQFLYVQGADANKRKTAYACQYQFGASGGFRGCLKLP